MRKTFMTLMLVCLSTMAGAHENNDLPSVNDINVNTVNVDGISANDISVNAASDSTKSPLAPDTLAGAQLPEAQPKKKTPFYENLFGLGIKLSGYGLLEFITENKNGSQSSAFKIRMARISLEGRILKHFFWKAQLQVHGNVTSMNASPRMVDYFVEWQQLPFLKVKLGQFKRPFTFENPMHPIDQGFYAYSQNIMKLAGFADRCGEHSSNGRDLGIQLQGDFLKVKGRDLLHYQIGVFNGQGINVFADGDMRKDVIGGLWITPVEGLRVGGFGWTGSYVKDGISLPKNRYAISAEYTFSDWTFRSEYIHSQGKAFGTDAEGKTIVKEGDQADGVYVLAIAPIIKKKLHVKARYDLYRDQATWDSAKTVYEIGADYMFSKHILVTAEYGYTYDRTASERKHGNFFDVQVNFRF